MTTTSLRNPLPLIAGEVVVRSVERLSPSYVRVELGGPALAEVGVDGPLRDQRFKLVFPGPTGRFSTFEGADESWFQSWTSVPVEERGHMRTYTVRAVRGSGADTRLVVDLVLHLAEGASGPASLWAARAEVGDRLGIVAPRRGHPFGGIEFEPGTASRLLLVGDETAVPAVASILEGLPADAAGTAYLEVPHSADVLPLTAPVGVRVVWLPRDGVPHGERACRAVLGLFGLGELLEPVDETDVDPDLWETPTHSSSGEPLPEAPEEAGGLYAWVAGESAMVTRLRRHLVRDAGLDRRQVAFMGYWRRGVAMRS
ncbi:MAG TPA: siderophore-interacting protein [Marmoricola sp.]|nr:siderophore-interacting protein [Marmoricola sp.]